jgi:hypothetical protein
LIDKFLQILTNRNVNLSDCKLGGRANKRSRRSATTRINSSLCDDAVTELDEMPMRSPELNRSDISSKSATHKFGF